MLTQCIFVNFYVVMLEKLGEASFASKMKLCDHSMGKYFLTWMVVVTHHMAQGKYQLSVTRSIFSLPVTLKRSVTMLSLLHTLPKPRC